MNGQRRPSQTFLKGAWWKDNREQTQDATEETLTAQKDIYFSLSGSNTGTDSTKRL